MMVVVGDGVVLNTDVDNWHITLSTLLMAMVDCDVAAAADHCLDCGDDDDVVRSGRWWRRCHPKRFIPAPFHSRTCLGP